MGLTLQQIHSLEVGWVDWLGMCARLSFLDAIEDSVNGEVVWHGTLALKSHDEEWKFGKCGQNGGGSDGKRTVGKCRLRSEGKISAGFGQRENYNL